jgi:HNH endonuclease
VPAPYADFLNPQSLNQYGFVGGNPASRSDVDGHCDWCKTFWRKVYQPIAGFVTCFCQEAKSPVMVGAVAIILNPPKNPGTAGGPRAGKPFTPKGKKEVIEQNKAENNGKTVCENCGRETVPAQQNKAGAAPPGNGTRVDHIYPKSENGDGSPSNGRVLCNDCNMAKGNTVLSEPVRPTPAPEPVAPPVEPPVFRPPPVEIIPPA